jgi:PBP1b-binding outer membrane lipoprotein LpoB
MMKKLSLALSITFVSLLFASCSNSEKEADTVVIEKETSAPAKEEGSNVKIDAKVDKDGNVSGDVSTEIELDDDK